MCAFSEEFVITLKDLARGIIHKMYKRFVNPLQMNKYLLTFTEDALFRLFFDLFYIAIVWTIRIFEA